MWCRIRKYTPYACCTGQGNDNELIATVQMESQHSLGMSTCHDFPRFVIISEKSRPEVGSRWRRSRNSWLFWKKNPYGHIFRNVFRKDSWRHRSMSCVQISWNLADRKSVKSCVAYQTKKKQNFASRFCADSVIPVTVFQLQLQLQLVFFYFSVTITITIKWY